jgi:preprotein translocase subunit YajC
MNLVFNTLNFLYLAQDTSDPKSALSTFILLPILFIVMYFLVIRPQRNDEKNRKKMIEELAKGDSVLTSSGIYGKVAEIKDNNETIVLNVGKETTISFTASSILKKVK